MTLLPLMELAAAANRGPEIVPPSPGTPQSWLPSVQVTAAWRPAEHASHGVIKCLCGGVTTKPLESTYKTRQVKSGSATDHFRIIHLPAMGVKDGTHCIMCGLAHCSASVGTGSGVCASLRAAILLTNHRAPGPSFADQPVARLDPRLCEQRPPQKLRCRKARVHARGGSRPCIHSQAADSLNLLPFHSDVTTSEKVMVQFEAAFGASVSVTTIQLWKSSTSWLRQHCNYVVCQHSLHHPWDCTGMSCFVGQPSWRGSALSGHVQTAAHLLDSRICRPHMQICRAARLISAHC